MGGLFYHDVLAALSAAGVPFVVVGGVAVNLQGVPRFTADVDLAVASPVPYDELARTAERLTAGGLTFAVASIDALIRMKSGTGRAQDASDVDALRRVKGGPGGA